MFLKLVSDDSIVIQIQEYASFHFSFRSQCQNQIWAITVIKKEPLTQKSKLSEKHRKEVESVLTKPPAYCESFIWRVSQYSQLSLLDSAKITITLVSFKNMGSLTKI